MTDTSTGPETEAAPAGRSSAPSDPVLLVILDALMLLMVLAFALGRFGVSAAASAIAPARTPPGLREGLGAGELAMPLLWFGGWIAVIIYALVRSKRVAELPFATPAETPSSSPLRLMPVLLIVVGTQSVGAGLVAGLGLMPKSEGPQMVAVDSGRRLRVPVSLAALADPPAPPESEPKSDTAPVSTTTAALTGPRVAASPGTSLIAVYPETNAPSILSIGGESVAEPRFLEDGQVLEIGERRWRFEAGAPPAGGKLRAGAVAALLTIGGVLLVVFVVADPAAVGLELSSVKADLVRGLRLYLAAAPGFLLAYFGSLWLVDAAGLHVISHPVEGLIGDGKTSTLALAVVSSCVLAPILEELLFRGLLLRALTQLLPATVAIGITAVVFAAMHLGLQTALPLTFLGALWGWMSLTGESKSIIAPMAAHALHNCVVFASYFIMKPLIAP